MRSLGSAAAAALCLLLAATSLNGGAAVASAGADGQVAVKSGVMWEGSFCDDYPVAYGFAPETNYETVTFDIEFTKPDGLSAGGTIIDGSGDRGVLQAFLCTSMPGRHQVRVTAEGCSYHSYEYCDQFDLGTTTFVMRLPNSRTKFRTSDARPQRGQTVRLSARVFDERPNGYFRTDYGSIHLEKRAGGRWSKVRGSEGYMGFGHWSWDVKYRGGTHVYRAVTHRSSDRLGSKSTPVTLR